MQFFVEIAIIIVGVADMINMLIWSGLKRSSHTILSWVATSLLLIINIMNAYAI